MKNGHDALRFSGTRALMAGLNRREEHLYRLGRSPCDGGLCTSFFSDALEGQSLISIHTRGNLANILPYERGYSSVKTCLRDP